MQEKPKVQVQVVLNKNLHRAAKLVLVEKGQTWQAFLESKIKELADGAPRSKKRTAV